MSVSPTQTELSSDHVGGESDVSEDPRKPTAGPPAERSLHSGPPEEPRRGAGDDLPGLPCGLPREAGLVGGEETQRLQ